MPSAVLILATRSQKRQAKFMNGTTIKSGFRGGGSTVPAIMPLFLMPAAAYVLFAASPAWQFVWALAISIYFGLKWLTFASSPFAGQTSLTRALGYLLLWPGMNAKAFLNPASIAARPLLREWLLAIVNLMAGIVLLIAIAPRALDRSPLL